MDIFFTHENIWWILPNGKKLFDVDMLILETTLMKLSCFQDTPAFSNLVLQ